MSEIAFDGFEQLITRITSLDKMYERIRVVDPVRKEVLYIRDNTGADVSDEEKKACYSVWGKDNICKNCVSMRTVNEKETFVKIETSPDKIVMVTSVPVESEDNPLVIELLKDVTNSMVTDDMFKESTHIAKLLEQANRAAVTDELTGIYNKRYIYEKLPADIALANLKQQPLSLIMADIDHFKKVNDTYGHLAGDHILKEFSGIIDKGIRDTSDWLARFGGEEFIICMPNTNSETAGKAAERIREAIQESVFHYNGKEISITSSFGLCSMDIDSYIGFDDLIACADENLYKAKKSGRNKVVSS